MAMRKTHLIVYLFFSVIAVGLISPSSEARRPINKIKVQGELKTELNSVLKATVDLQESIFKDSDGKISQNIKKLVQKIDSASKKTHLAKEQKTHMLKMLTAAKTALEKSRRTTGADRHTFLQVTFKQLVGLAQTYQLDKYKIFFCPKDRSVWLQRGNKPQNPVNPGTLGTCGKPVT
jgi:hypothetical protein